MEIILEEISDGELTYFSHYLAINATNLNSLPNDVRLAPTVKQADKNLENAIVASKNIILELPKIFKQLRNDESTRRIFRSSGNTYKDLFSILEKFPKFEKIFRKILGNNTYENLSRLPKFIKGVKNINSIRLSNGNNNYRDFTKEISELEMLYNKLLSKRLASVTTEKVNYFPY